MTVVNTGTADLTLGNLASTDPLVAPFSVLPASDNCSGALLAPTTNCTFTVSFV